MLPVNVRVATKRNTIEEAAQAAFKSGLYQNTFWMFYEILQTPRSILKIATAFHNRKRVGVSIFWDWEQLPDYRDMGYEPQLGCFVKEDYRRHKVGSQLITRMKQPDSVCIGTGLADSVHFWESVIKTPNWTQA